MALSLTQLRLKAAEHRIDADDGGFSIEPRKADGEAFNRLVREALDNSGNGFVAFPQTNGRSGYAALYVIPLD